MINTAKSTPILLFNDEEFSQRFCYWHGASGRRYIHSVYTAETCPQLPGAVHVIVRQSSKGLEPVDVFVLGAGTSLAGRCRLKPGDQVHVHMLAGGSAEAIMVMRDISENLFGYIPLAADRTVTADPGMAIPVASWQQTAPSAYQPALL